jgi:hypothetical protein
MAGPPTDVAPSDLFRKLLETPRPTELIDFPRRQANGEPIGKIRIQVLTQEEHDGARERAHRSMKAKGFDKEDFQAAPIQEVTGDAVARELLAMASLTENGPDDGSGTPMYGRVFRGPEDLKKLRSDEIAVLFNAYLLTQAKYGPFEKFVGGEEDLNAWIKRLEEGGSEFPLLVLPLPQLAELAYSLAQRAFTLSVILESLWSSLPPTLQSSLAGFSMGTTFYGGPAATSTEAGGESSTERAITIEEAARATQAMRGE